jgi:DNA polymerase-1
MNLIIVDFYNLLYRSHYGFGTKLTNSKGMELNAIHGFLKTILKLKQDFPNDLIVCATESTSNWRKTVYPEYKGTRSKMPDELKQQKDIIIDLLNLMNIEILNKENYEADDIIAVLSKNENYQIKYIITSDKDMLQLINDKVIVLDLMKNQVYNEQEVLTRYGFLPENLADYLSLLGDTSDNIPGALGIGEKTAKELIVNYKTIINIYEHVNDIKANTSKKLIASKDNVLLSYDLIELRNKKFDFELNPCSMKPLLENKESLIKELHELGLYQISNNIRNLE